MVGRLSWMTWGRCSSRAEQRRRRRRRRGRSSICQEQDSSKAAPPICTSAKLVCRSRSLDGVAWHGEQHGDPLQGRRPPGHASRHLRFFTELPSKPSLYRDNTNLEFSSLFYDNFIGTDKSDTITVTPERSMTSFLRQHVLGVLDVVSQLSMEQLTIES